MSGRPWEPYEVEAARVVEPGAIPALARRLGRTPSAVRRFRQVRGFAGERAPAWTDEQKRQLNELIDGGATVTEAARAIGRSRQTVYFRRHKAKQAGVAVLDLRKMRSR